MKHQRHLTLIPSTGALELIVVDLLGTYPWTKNGNQLVVIVTDRYSKLTRALTTTKTSASYVATVMFDDWIIR